MNNTATNTAPCPTVRKQIGKTTFIVCVKQSETAKKPIEKMFKDMCRHEVTRDFLADNLMNLEKLPKTS